MKNLSFVSVLVLIFSFAVFAQTNENLPCVTISVYSPTFDIPFTIPLKLVADIKNKFATFNVNYKWTLTNGEIIKGQGTYEIEVLQNDISKNLTVTVEVTGLPKDCSNIASETMSIDTSPEALLIEELLRPIAQIKKTRAFEKPAALENNPDAQLYIIFTYRKNTPQKIITRTEQKLFNKLLKIGIEKQRIVLIKDFADKELIQFWLVPPGVTPPTIKK